MKAAFLLSRGQQIHQAYLVAHVSAYNPIYQQQAHTLGSAALGIMAGQVIRQASIMAFVDNFRLFGMLSVLCLPLVLLFKKVKASGAVAMH
ncbi:MAG: hypothetical protein ACYCW6_32060 [Candidatus Xenobia bacterium]